ncbi:zinc-ribbon and DUF3426 domain-containing protein [Kangiella sediminilitoris]|uniref:MJ0042 family finger-like protein n=1 Tax=Kangiella sediminilitoris TaxID=1144748 RepID=A0A1B3BDK1_9GAMM|nr:zinc-ribbon and DUF3426 domain-containing protein [Kangiella sediminilitoris]AOE50848.1 MJ0042 family finger-like protein [Kangiella sediminilitoris]
MSETFLTNCPHCKSVFKLRKEHLEVASGHVRCGNCHSLFLATDSLVSLDKESQKAQMSDTVEQAEDKVVSQTIPELHEIDRSAHYELDSMDVDSGQAKSRNHLSTLKWAFYGFATLILIYLSFWFFYLWPNKETLAQDTTLRPIYQLSCSMFGCQLAPRQDLEQYRVNAIEVNITRTGQKEVSMVLKNVAQFSQPYPQIKVILSDIKGNQFASPVYKPQHYLPEVNHNDLIKPQQSVHIAFTFNNEITDYSGYQVELVK